MNGRSVLLVGVNRHERRVLLVSVDRHERSVLLTDVNVNGRSILLTDVDTQHVVAGLAVNADDSSRTCVWMVWRRMTLEPSSSSGCMGRVVQFARSSASHHDSVSVGSVNTSSGSGLLQSS